MPASTEISEKLSQDLKKRGFTTICYALMQAIEWSMTTQEVFCTWKIILFSYQFLTRIMAEGKFATSVILEWMVNTTTSAMHVDYVMQV